MNVYFEVKRDISFLGKTIYPSVHKTNVLQGGDRQLLGQSDKEELGATPSEPAAGYL